MKRGPYKKASLVDRLERRTTYSGTCWLWEGCVNNMGYGQITSGGSTLQVHRVAYEQLVGDVPDGVNVLHRCDTPRCWNPQHLFLGTHADNVADKVAKRRHVFGERHPWTGRKIAVDEHPSTKITDADMVDVRFLVGQWLTQAAVAREYGVGQSCISRRLSGARGG